MERTEHFESCSAALCKDMTDKEKGEAIWYPGEEICSGKPPNDFIKEQQRMNRRLKKGTASYGNKSYTAKMLETTKRDRKPIGKPFTKGHTIGSSHRFKATTGPT